MTTYDIEVTGGASGHPIGSVLMGPPTVMWGAENNDELDRYVAVRVLEAPLPYEIGTRVPVEAGESWAASLSRTLSLFIELRSPAEYLAPADMTLIRATLHRSLDAPVVITATRATLGQGRIQSFQQWYARAEVPTISTEHPTRLHSFNVYLNKPDTSWVHLLAAVFKKLAEVEHLYTTEGRA